MVDAVSTALVDGQGTCYHALYLSLAISGKAPPIKGARPTNDEREAVGNHVVSSMWRLL
jgi:hypothetical protein